MTNGKYYPNNWEAISNAPSEAFQECSWEEFHDWRLCAWDLPGSVACIIRAQRKDTGEVTEHVYQKPWAAKRRLMLYLQDGEHELTVCNRDSIHLILSEEEDNDTETD